MLTRVLIANLYTRGFPSQNALTIFRAEPEPSSCRINSGDMRSVGHITRRVFWGAPKGVAGITGIVTTTASARLVHNTAFISGYDHAVIISREGPDEGIHVVLHPLRQVTPDGLGYGSDGSIKVEVGVGDLEVGEDLRERTSEQAASPFFDKLASPLRTDL